MSEEEETVYDDEEFLLIEAANTIHSIKKQLKDKNVFQEVVVEVEGVGQHSGSTRFKIRVTGDPFYGYRKYRFKNDTKRFYDMSNGGTVFANGVEDFVDKYINFKRGH